MDLTSILHTLTIISSIVGVGFWTWKASVNAINQMQKETHNITNSIREDTKRHDAEFQETRKLWAKLLQENNSKETKP